MAPVDRVVLLGGAHYVTSRDGIGWILSKPSENGILALTKLSLTNGVSSTQVVDDREEFTPNSAILSADDAGHLWFTYYLQIMRIDQETGAIDRWDPPPPLPDASPSDEHPEAGQLMANAWDPTTNTLLFLRNVDHRLYRFDPSSETFSTVADLPIVTHSLSRVSVGVDGTTTINGGLWGATIFSPTAVVLSAAADPPRAIAGILSVCIDPSGVATIDQAGAVRIGERSIGTLDAKPYSDVTFVCDGIGHVFSMGDVFSADGSEANVVVYRFALAGSVDTTSFPLMKSTGINHVTGEPMTTWGGAPSVETLLPDGEGGVWLVNTDGTSSMSEVGDSLFPTLMRIRL
jgi:hypothetical protein